MRGSSGFGIAYAMADNREKRAGWLKGIAPVNAWVYAEELPGGGEVALLK